MKKITLLLSFIVCVVFAQAQNLLSNPSFETWTNGTLPDSWTITSNTGTISKVATTAPSLTGFAYQLAGCTATTTVSQKVLPPNGAANFDTNTTYQLSVSYLVTAGDGTDARVWSGLMTSAVGATAAYFAVPATHADSLKYYIPFHGPGGSVNPPSGTFGNDINGYLLDTRTSGVWHTYTCDIVFPTGITQFDFAVRQYTTSTVLWDNFKFGVKGTLDALNSPSVKPLSVYVKGNVLTVNAVEEGSIVDVYSTIGAKVQSSKLTNGAIQLNDLSKGLYVVRVGNATSKIML